MGDGFIDGEVGTDLSVSEYIHAVCNKSLPGGGSVAALTGSLAAALAGKVCRLTTGRKEFLEYEDQTQAVMEEAARITSELEELMQEDAEAYRGVVEAYRLPRETGDEKDARNAALETAWKRAVEVPMDIAEKCLRVVNLGRTLIGRSNRTTTSDIAIAAMIAYGAVEGVVIVIKDNLNKVKDRPWADQQLEKAERISTQAALDWEEIRRRVDDLCGCTL